MKRKIFSIAITLIAFFSGIATNSAYTSKNPALNAFNEAQQEEPSSDKNIILGKASWYSKRSPGINYRTANNEVFNDQDHTCAMWGVSFNQKIKVTNLNNGKSIIVRVNDRGPHKRFVRKGRVIDLTQKAFKQIAPLKNGLINVQLELL